MKEKVEKALQKVRPMLQADGGDVELVDVQDGMWIAHRHSADLDRLAMQYQRRFNGHATPTMFATAGDSRFVFAEASRDAATVIAVPQRLTKRDPVGGTRSPSRRCRC